MRTRVGPKLRFTSPEILGEVINAYFDHCDEINEPYTITGLCLNIGMARPTLLGYEKRDEFKDVIMQARLIIQNQLELRMLGPGRATGAIFALKQHGWRDKQDIHIGGDADPQDMKWTVEVVDPKDVKKGDKDEVSDSNKVTPFPGRKKAL